MSIDLINITAREIIDLCKAEYYNQTGQTIQIGSDEYASSAVLAYVIQLLSSNINTIAINRYIDTARGEYLDAIASNYGINARPEGYSATAMFSVYHNNSSIVTIDAGEIVVKDDAGNKFLNKYNQLLNPGYNTIVLYSVNPGSKYNGIPANAINIIESGGSYIYSATNITQTYGGTDGFPYTDEGDDEFRAWLKNEIRSFSGAGTYLAYESRAKNADSRVLDAYVLRQDDEGYQKGKVQIFILTDPDSDINGQVKQIVQSSCSDESFRPIGDFVQVEYAPIEDFSLPEIIQVTYLRQFQGISTDRNVEIRHKYRDYVLQKINRPFIFEELCSMLKDKDDNGVYAIDAKPLDVTNNAYIKPKSPSIGGVLRITNIPFQNTFV